MLYSKKTGFYHPGRITNENNESVDVEQYYIEDQQAHQKGLYVSAAQHSPLQPSLIDIFNFMSIYSGFATRQQEETYDNYLLGLIEILQRRLLMFFRNE